MSQSSKPQGYGFSRLELQPFTRLDIDGLGIEEVKFSEPEWDSYSAEKARSLTNTFSAPFDNPTASSSNTTYRNIGSEEQILPNYHRDDWPFTSSDSKESIRTSFLQRKSRRLATTWAMAILAIITAAFSTFYSYRVLVNHAALPDSLVLSPGATVLVVNIMSHLVAYLCWLLFSNTIEALRWALACRPEGILLTSFLAMSRATPFMGVLYLCVSKGRHKIWAIQRILCYICTTVLTIVLITNVTFRNIYTPYTTSIDRTNATQPVVAGLAPINTNGLTKIPLALINTCAAYTMSFITDPRWVASIEPVTCSGKECLSIFLPGGVDNVRYDDGTGGNTLFSGKFPGDYSTIVVNNAPGFQIEYTSIESVDPNFQFDHEKDCKMYLQSLDDGLYICMVQKDLQLYLGWTICPIVTNLLNLCQTDLSWTQTIRWNTTVSLYNRLATVAYDSQNISILSIESITPPAPYRVPIEDFQLYCDMVLAPIPPVMNMTANQTAFEGEGTNFNLEFGFGFLLRLYESDFATYSDGGLSLLRSFLAVPFQFSTSLQQLNGIKNLPNANHVTASLSKSSYRALIERWTVWVFGFVALLLISWSVGWLLWITFWGPNSPNTSSFPELDVTSKSSIHRKFERADETLNDLGRLAREFGLGNGMSKDVLKAIDGKRVFCGSFTGEKSGESHIVLVTERGQVKLLAQGEAYS